MLRDIDKIDGIDIVRFMSPHPKDFTDDVIDAIAECKSVCKVDGIERVKFISPHPKDFTDDVIEAIANNEKVCRIIHLPLQSGNTKVLKEMNRKYTKEQYLSLAEKMKERIK